MIDPDIIKRSPEILRKNLERREYDFPLEKFLELDRARRELQVKVDSLRAESNRISDEIGKAKAQGKDISPLVEKAKKIRREREEAEEMLKKVREEWKKLALEYPNIASEDIPDRQPEIVRQWGEPTSDEHKIPHWEIAKKFGIIDFDTAGQMSGSGFAVMVGQGAKLERALINFMIDLHTSKGYTEYFAPYLVREKSMIGTGHLPKFAQDMYRTEEDNLWLIPTAEVTLVNLWAGKIIPEDKTPVKCVTYSACFRREAGSWGQDVRGLIRQHQFNKVELVKITKPEDSERELEELVRDAEEVLKLLEIPYRVVLLPANDIGFASAKTYDIEVWLPGQKRWLEISSCSNCTDFQARRSLIRIRRKNGKVELAHTLNGSGVAIGRCIVALLENHLQPDGTIKIPEPLRDYLKADKITPQKH